ncbi:MAG TPA: GGDEF domain-containing protein [Candidatus Nanopelagicales bacterium]|nr:GGDEF domain-containing protein [Candidatus Nanopelagicales bacterium]
MSAAPLLLDAPSRPTRAAWWAWLVGGGAYLAVAGYVATRADEPLAHLPWVAVSNAIAMAIIAGVTALLLYAHAARSGGLGYLALTSTFATVCLLQLAVPLVFPGAFVDGPLLGGTQSSITLFYVWHLVFLLGIPLSALLLARDARLPHRSAPPHGVVEAAVVGLLPGLLLVGWIVLLPGMLPHLTGDEGVTMLAQVLDRVLVVVAVAGLAVVVVATRGATAIGRWLLAVATLGVGEAVVNLGAERFSLGWYFNRTLGLFTMSMLLMALVWEIARVSQSAYDAASRDGVTGAASRTVFLAELDRAVESAIVRRDAVAVLWLDLDRFKEVNDAFGHQVGDELLADVARRVLTEIRRTDLLGRMGGDEFAVLLTGVRVRDAVEPVADRIAERLRLPFSLGDALVSCPCSVGVSYLPGDARTARELLSHADQAMYRAKHRGGSAVVHYGAEPERRAPDALPETD